jgi:BirA family transcriptional regulator, biotin operon repressor / biotin---[acetyl-CoA-carboxylase] ligase
MNIARLRDAFPERRIEYYDEVDSTMLAAAELPLASVVLADRQTAGQGRHGRPWHSEPGSGIYCSVVLEPAPLLTMALGLAAQQAIVDSTGLVCDLRWPNDLMLGGRKVAGILVQLVDGRAIAGIGINVNHQGFPPELASEATSLRLHAGRPFEREEILLALLPAIDSFIAEPREAILRLFTHASSYAVGRRVTVSLPEGVIEGATAGLDDSGYLLVRQDDGNITVVVAGGVRAAGS